MADTTFTNLDFNQVKDDIVKYLSNQDRFKDYDFTGSNMSILMDVLAYNTVLNNVYTNMAFSEMFMDTAQLKESVVSHAKELNYLPRSKKGSVAYLDITFSANDSPSSILIPRYTEFTGKGSNKSYKFLTTESVSVKANSAGDYIKEDLEIKQGRLVTEFYQVSNELNRYVISNEDVDLSTIRVIVRDSSDADSDSAEYIKKSNIFGVDSDDNVFYVQPYLDDKYEIVFGNDVFGTQPENGNVVEVKYLVSSGEETNGISVFTKSTNISGYSASVETSANSTGGAEAESIDSIRFYAPKSIQIQERAVTKNDYEILLKNQFNEIESISVYGGEEDTPPKYGKVIVNVDTESGDGVSEKNKEKYRDFLIDRCPIGIEPIIRSAEFMYIYVDTSVYYDFEVTNNSDADTETLVRTQIENFSTNNLSDFNKTFRYSKFVNDIDSADDSILSNDTTTKAFVEVVPSTTSNNNIDIDFNNEIISGEESSVISTTFTYNNESRVYFRDDGSGAIHISKIADGSVVDIKKNVGSVNYTTGKFEVPTIPVSSYTGSAIKIYATLKNKDITPPKNRIISIRDEDVLVTPVSTET